MVSRSIRTATAIAAALAGSLAAQQPIPAADAYSFAEREPRSQMEKTVHELLPKIVKIHGASGLRTVQGYGTGVLVSEQGHILALDQVMLQAEQTRVVLHDGSVHMAELLPPDRKLGVRMLKIDAGRPLPYLDAAANEAVQVGTFVLSIGNCFRLAEFSEKLSVTFGMLVAKVRTGLRYRLQDVDYDGMLLVTDAANNPGHGGGGLFTLDGRWLGLNGRLVQSRETNTDISAAIPVEDLKPYVERWTLGKVAEEAVATEVVPVHHGIRLFDHGGRTSPPAYIERVQRGSPGAAAGLRPDDLIVRLDDVTVRTCQQFENAMDKRRPGQTVAVTYKRGTRVVRTEMTLEAKK